MVMASHWVGLTLPGMIEEPGSFSGRINSPKPERGPEPRKRMSLAILNRSAASALSAPWANTSAPCDASASNLFGAVTNGRPVMAADSFGKRLGEAALGVEAGADRGAALRQRIKLLQAGFDARDAGRHLRGIAGEFLAERQRRRILGVGAADLDDGTEFFGLRLQRGLQMCQRRQQPLRDFFRRRDMHRGREAVVRRLAHIDVIVGMDRRFLAALAAEHFVGAVGDHLVDVHVGLGAGAGLPHRQREMIVELAVDDLLRRLHDGLCAARIERSERQIGFRRGALDDGERADDRARHALLADAEIIARALGLRAPVAVRRHFDRAERIGFGAGLHFFLKRSSRTTSAPPRAVRFGLGNGSRQGFSFARTWPAPAGAVLRPWQRRRRRTPQPDFPRFRTASRIAPPDRRKPSPHRRAP